MTTQDAVTNALAALSGSPAALATAFFVAVALWLGAEYALDALDAHLPMRQLMLGRTLNALAKYWRYLHMAAAAHGAQVLGSRTC